MEKIFDLIREVLDGGLIRAVISNPREKEGVRKVKVRPVELKGSLYFQFESFTKTQAFHENLMPEEAYKKLISFTEQFRQMQIDTVGEECTVLISKKGKVTIRRKKREKAAVPAEKSHNRKKHYILEEGIYVPFLHDLGVMTSEGKIVRARMDKFRQINRFLEFIEDVLPELDGNGEIRIIDFGCGKSYLTFAVYYYLHELKGYDVRITGLDLKKDVIRHCEDLARKYGYEKLNFCQGDIAGYESGQGADLVITLHACDTATDYALEKAVAWDAKVILSVPCCQHELNAQIKGGEEAGKYLAPVLDYGLLKERFAALLTDGLRAKYLENAGYDTQVLEFIDMEHTPKNILIRAVKNKGRNKNTSKDIENCRNFFGVDPTLGRILS